MDERKKEASVSEERNGRSEVVMKGKVQDEIIGMINRWKSHGGMRGAG